MSREPPKTVTAVEGSRRIRAQEWAIRQGMDIARAHLPRDPAGPVFALAADIAEALQGAARFGRTLATPTQEPPDDAR